jgi:hypothetical protein
MQALERGELLPHHEIFQKKVATRAKQAGDCAKTEPDDREHDSDITQTGEMRPGPKSLILKPSSIWANHNVYCV